MPASTSRSSVPRSASEQLLFSPVQPQTAFSETLRRLQSAIKLGLLAPGSKLPAERDLCAQLGISRSTLRQALLTLSESGYVRATRGRGGGTFVVDRPPPTPASSPQDRSDWLDLCNERLAIELGVVVLAALRTTSESAAPLQRLVTELEATEDHARYSQLDRQLHIAIAALTGCRRLIIASTRVQSSIFDLLSPIDVPPNTRARSDAGHRALLAALLASDQFAAMNAVYAHLKDTAELLGRELATQPAG